MNVSHLNISFNSKAQDKALIFRVQICQCRLYWTFSQVKQATVKEKCLANTPVDKHAVTVICGDRVYIRCKEMEATNMPRSPTGLVNLNSSNYYPQTPICCKSPGLSFLMPLILIILLVKTFRQPVRRQKR